MNDAPGSDLRGYDVRKIAGIGAGFLAITLVWSVYNTYMPLLLAQFTTSATLRGAIMGLDNLLALLLIPVIGSWSDRLSGPLGKRLPFVLLGMPLAAAAFLLLPFSSIAFWLLIAVDVVFLLAMTVIRAPIIALMPDHVQSEQRSSANGVINLMGGIGGVIAFLALAPLYDLANYLPFVLAAGLLLVAVAVLFRVADRHPPFVASGAGTDDAAPVSALLRDLRRMFQVPEGRAARWALLAIFLYSLGFSGLEAQFSTYAVGHLGLSGGLAGLLLGGFSLAFVAAAVPAGILGTRLGKAPAMRIGLLAITVLLGLLTFSAGTVTTAAGLVLAGLAWALVNVQAYPLIADQGGKDRIGFYTGLYYLFSMSAAVVGPTLAGFAMDSFGLVTLFPVAAAGFALGLVALTRARGLAAGLER